MCVSLLARQGYSICALQRFLDWINRIMIIMITDRAFLIKPWIRSKTFCSHWNEASDVENCVLCQWIPWNRHYTTGSYYPELLFYIKKVDCSTTLQLQSALQDDFLVNYFMPNKKLQRRCQSWFHKTVLGYSRNWIANYHKE